MADPVVAVELVQRWTAPGGRPRLRERRVARWTGQAASSWRLPLPRVAPSWSGEAVALCYVLRGRTTEGATVELPVVLGPALPPAEGADQPTRDQRAWARYARQRRAARGLLAIASESILTLASLTAVGLGLHALLTGGPPGPGGWPAAVFGLGWLLAYSVVSWRRIRARRRLGTLDRRAVALGGTLPGRCAEGCLASLVLVEHHTVVDEQTGARTPARLVRTLDRRYVGAGPFTVPIPADGPASDGMPEAGVSWWVQLETAEASTRLPFTVLPWGGGGPATGERAERGDAPR